MFASRYSNGLLIIMNNDSEKNNNKKCFKKIVHKQYQFIDILISHDEMTKCIVTNNVLILFHF